MSEQRDPRTYAIIGVAMEVHRVLGPGFLEKVYQEALAVEFSQHEIPFQRKLMLPIEYKGTVLNARYFSDFICFGSVIVECKATNGLTGVDESQAINYLKATGYRVALLLNFGTPSLQYKRLVN